MRGLDMALGESFNVKLVLLPEGEDPDSFVQKSGAEAFKTYVEQNKRDVIGFRMEVGLKEAGNDPMKRSQLVNEIAETISKINKTEDFTLQQYYIRESATQLQIDEQGLINLVNKFIRERLQQEQRHNDRKQTQQQEPAEEPSFYFDEETGESVIIDVLQKDYGEEWQLLRILLEYGNKPFKEEGTVAQLFFETIDLELLENPLAKRMVTEYHEYWTSNHQIPDHKYFTSHTDKVIRQKAADLLHVHHVPSQNWQEKHRIEVLHGDQIYEAEIESTFAYFELKLLRRLLNENMKQMQYEKDIQKIMVLMKAHQSLKLREKELMSIVIVR
jgi:DNA primase